MPEYQLGLSYTRCRELLGQRLAEPAPAPIQLLSGPRQVGKTTLLLEIADMWGARAIYASADSPEGGLPGFWQRLWVRAEEVATAQGSAIVLLDEVHVVPNWSGKLKGEWDRLKRKRVPVHIVATGSSALRIGSGSRESLAGRFERMTLTHWSAASLVEIFNISAERAAEIVVQIGGYPGVMSIRGDTQRRLAYIRDSIVEPAIGRDILALGAVRKPALLRQIFAVSTSRPAEIVALQKLQGQLQDRGAIETVAHYLDLLQEAYLIAPLQKYSRHPARGRAAPPKLVTLSNALLAVTDPRGIPDMKTKSERRGHWIENVCLAHAWNSGQQVRYWREEPLEVDGIIDGSWGLWAIEVKTGNIQAADLRGLLEFTARFPEYRPLLICEPAGILIAQRAGIPAQTWQEFLMNVDEIGVRV